MLAQSTLGADLWPVATARRGVTLEFAQIEDQQGKFNINNLALQRHHQPGRGSAVSAAADLLGLETKWAWLIADWIDADNQPNFPDGAEDSVYLSQTPPYRAAESAGHEHLGAAGAAGVRTRSLQPPAPYISALPPGTSHQHLHRHRGQCSMRSAARPSTATSAVDCWPTAAGKAAFRPWRCSHQRQPSHRTGTGASPPAP